MKPVVTVVDYGLGNLFSVGRALEHLGAAVVTADSPSLVRQAERLILPGVGSFSNGMAGLRQRELVSAIQDFARSCRPFLGICLGMQMMFDVSEEFGVHPGLGLIAGKVVALAPVGADGKSNKIPHIGWNALHLAPRCSSWERTVLATCTPGDAVYFVHSFTAWPTDESHRLADSEYGGQRISAVVQLGTLVGCQFHPEKSGTVGLRILRQFVEAH